MRRSLIPAMMAAVVLATAVPAAAQVPTLTPPQTIIGLLVDNACYALSGARAGGTDHTKCAMVCASRGGRVALVTATGLVYMVIGAWTQDNNAKLIPFMNSKVVVVGTVSGRILDSTVPVVVAKSDNRRPTGSLDGVVTKKVPRKGDYREGDVPDVTEMTIDATSVQFAPTPTSGG